MRRDTEKCLRNAHLLRAMLERAGVRVLLNDLSSTVVFERPMEEAFVKKWQARERANALSVSSNTE